jgi:riboflavin kinase/FMN adenylyltransferase
MKTFFATIGFFDGVHRGHQYLIAQLLKAAQERGMSAAVVSFAQHPRKVLHQDFQPQLLTTCREKVRLLKEFGVEECFLLDFTPTLSALTAREFMQLLKVQYGVQGLLIGYDHRFGHDRSEGWEDYLRYGKELGMEVLLAKPYMLPDGKAISSSLIRHSLKEGRVAEANDCLGYPYTLQGIVVRGHQVGRSIGFPTANIQLEEEDKLLPADGVYAVRVEVGGVLYGGMLSIGKRPTIDNGNDRSIEVYIFHFDGDLYGQTISLQLVEHTRPEVKFCSKEDLMAQLQKDRKQIEELLKDPAK